MLALRWVALFVAAVSLAGSGSATVLPLRSFDSFLQAQHVNSVMTGSNPGTVWTQSSVVDYTIPGNERDIALVASSGQEDRFISGGVDDNMFWFQATPEVTGYALIQYDGKDHTTQLDGPTVNGLQNFDLTMNGLGDSMQFMMSSSVTNSIVYLSFYFYDSRGYISSAEFIPPTSSDGVDRLYNIPFSSLRGRADLTNLGAFEVVIDQFSECRIDMSGLSIARNTADTHGDTCHSALPAMLGETATLGTEGLSYSNICGLATDGPSTWFYVVAGATTTAVFSTCGEATNFDTVIAVVNNCDELQCIAANDDTQCNGEDSSSSAVHVNVQQGHVYFIMVAGYQDASGLFALDIYLDP